MEFEGIETQFNPISPHLSHFGSHDLFSWADQEELFSSAFTTLPETTTPQIPVPNQEPVPVQETQYQYNSSTGSTDFRIKNVTNASPKPVQKLDGQNSSSSSEMASLCKTESKSAILERKRRAHYNQSLFNLRTLVPKITKMDKASTIKDAIEYIRELQEEERNLSKADLCKSEFKEAEYEEEASINGNISFSGNNELGSPLIELLEISIMQIGENLAMVSISCKKMRGAMAKVCKALESLNYLKIIASNFTVVSQLSVLYTLHVETEMGSLELKEKIEMAIYNAN
ncbi:hypothetical protein LUZ60_001631 [Juncus effusus]|nr:hypothetical protein LUZ60_001631 [Juncus effusus]